MDGNGRALLHHHLDKWSEVRLQSSWTAVSMLCWCLEVCTYTWWNQGTAECWKYALFLKANLHSANLLLHRIHSQIFFQLEVGFVSTVKKRVMFYLKIKTTIFNEWVLTYFYSWAFITHQSFCINEIYSGNAFQHSWVIQTLRKPFWPTCSPIFLSCMTLVRQLLNPPFELYVWCTWPPPYFWRIIRKAKKMGEKITLNGKQYFPFFKAECLPWDPPLKVSSDPLPLKLLMQY